MMRFKETPDYDFISSSLTTYMNDITLKSNLHWRQFEWIKNDIEGSKISNQNQFPMSEIYDPESNNEDKGRSQHSLKIKKEINL